ncbi:amino acid permease GAP1 [Sugiyamaella lignohabitans]|uniref:Amino acid permease GAP1 n=1 Tax=Sugiyamaella lignohabitans TaxID=796027 RepID=A0A167F8X2_9ASCO|nr:amino acid permease GAP1 [Sugiyamaella lignohabitans]ANB14973.1 amino acid permease GAP1 [Sugiyamaella lignohabitans]
MTEDVEKNPGVPYDKSAGSGVPVEEGYIEQQNGGFVRNFVDSFKPIDLSDLDTEGMTPVEIAAAATARSPLKRSLKGRHLQMIAIGGAIGTGLFIGSGGSLATGGAAGVLIGFSLTGAMLYCTVHALGELAVRFPVSGAFSTYSTRFLDPSWGFAMGWNYALQWLVVFPLELVAASITIEYWNHTINPDAFVVIFYVLVVFINLFGSRGYGEAEFVFSLIKVLAVVGFIILGIILVCGGGPHGGYIGGKYWHDPGAFASGVKGVISVFVNAAFSFSGTELVGLAAAETDNPRKTLPSAVKQVFWRITLFYIVALALVGLLVPYNDPKLLQATSSVDITASPFVIAISNAGIRGLPSVINVVILISVLSVGNSAVYGCSRTLCAMAVQGFAPKFLGYIDRKGRPLFAVIGTLIFGLLCFIAGSGKQNEVFNWLLAFSGLSALFTWGSICVCHIRVRRAMAVQGVSTDELAFTAALGVWGSWFGFLLNFVIICLEFWLSLYPVGAATPNAQDFFQSYLSVPLVLAMYIGHKIYSRSGFIRAKDIDLFTGIRELDRDLLRQEIEEERAYIKSKGWYYRIYKFWC